MQSHLTCCRITGYSAISTIHMRAPTSQVCQAEVLIRLLSCFLYLFELPAGACGVGDKSIAMSLAWGCYAACLIRAASLFRNI
jgi:hypothetical protein